MDARARDINETEKVTVETFTIIYKLTEWLHQIGLERKPEREVDQLVAQVKILKYFSSQKNTHVAGGRVVMGTIHKNNLVKIVRAGEIVGSGKILELQQGKSPTDKVEVDNEFGMQLESPIAPESGDMLEVIIKVIQ